MVDFAKLNLDAKEIVTISMSGATEIQDVSKSIL